MPQLRPLHMIAEDVFSAWANPYFGAVPYLKAMRHLSSISDNYIYDTGASVVRYFLANAQSFRGEQARRLKAELKAHLATIG